MYAHNMKLLTSFTKKHIYIYLRYPPFMLQMYFGGCEKIIHLHPKWWGLLGNFTSVDKYWLVITILVNFGAYEFFFIH